MVVEFGKDVVGGTVEVVDGVFEDVAVEVVAIVGVVVVGDDTVEIVVVGGGCNGR